VIQAVFVIHMPPRVGAASVHDQTDPPIALITPEMGSQHERAPLENA